RPGAASPLWHHHLVRGPGHGGLRGLGERRLGPEGRELMAAKEAVQRDEVITQALVRIVELPERAGRAALITLDNGRDHTRPNTLGPGGLAAFDAAITAALDASPEAIAMTGKPFNFA